MPNLRLLWKSRFQAVNAGPAAMGRAQPHARPPVNPDVGALSRNEIAAKTPFQGMKVL
jgi:hypothetical protein